MDRNYRINTHDRSREYNDEPPHSRLFILCGKDVTEDDLRQGFSPFGNIQEIRCVKDRNTGESKGEIIFGNYSEVKKTAPFCI